MQILRNFPGKSPTLLVFLLVISCTPANKVIEPPESTLDLKELKEKLEKGKPPCQYCGGSFSKTCTSCDGKGTIPCTEVGPYWRSCNATGLIDCYQNLFEDIKSDHSNCKLCGGKKKLRCTLCNGTGRVRCKQCNGTGIVPCPFCTNR